MIAIKDIDMPYVCRVCPLLGDDPEQERFMCRVYPYMQIPYPSKSKPDWCPLKEARDDA